VEEIWKDIKGYEKLYQISNLGKVKSFCRSKERILKIGIRPDGYEQIFLCMHYSRKHYFVHRLVALHFLKNPENKPEINHKNGIKTNNCVDNLEWVTHKENMHHAILNGLENKRGEAHPNVKLTWENVIEIKTLLQSKVSCDTIANKYNVSIPTVYAIKNKHAWNYTEKPV